MAKRTPARENSRPAALDDVEENLGLGGRDEAALERVMQARDEMGAGVEWKYTVTRLAGPEKKDGGRYENRLFQQEVEQLPTLNAYLSAEYGDGTYRVRVWRDRGVFAQWDVVIELSPAERAAFREKVRTLNNSGTTVAPVAIGAGSDNPMVAMMAQQTEIMRQLVDRVSTPADPMAQFRGVAEAFKSFQELQPKREAETGIEMFNKGMALAKEIMVDREPAGGRTGVLDLVRDAINNPTFGEAVGAFLQNLRPVQQQPQQRQPQQRPAIAPAAPRPATVAPAAPLAPAAAEDPNEAMIAQAIDYLCNQAKAGAQPQLFSDQALEMMPNGLLMELEREPDMLGYLIERFPQIEPQRLWFEALLADMFPPEDGGADNATPANEPAKPAAVAP